MASRKASSPAPSTSTNQDGETVTHLKMAGLTVLMVQKKDQVIYKLPDNMSVNSLSTDQREQLLKEINQLHSRQVANAAATTAAPAATQDTTATTVPSSSARPATATQYPNNSTVSTPTSQQNGTPAGSRAATPGTSVFPISATPSSTASASANGQPVKTTRKYTKTGKYSKKKLQQQQQQESAAGGVGGSSNTTSTTVTGGSKPGSASGTTVSVNASSLQQSSTSAGPANPLEANPQWILLTEIHTLQLRQQAQQILLSHYRDQDTIMKTMMAANAQDVPHQDRSVLARNISEVEQLLNIIKAQVEIKEKAMLAQFPEMSKSLQQMASQHHLQSLQAAAGLPAPKPLPSKGYLTTLTMGTILNNLTPLELFQIQDLQKLQQQQKQLVIQVVAKPGLAPLATSLAGTAGTMSGGGASTVPSTATAATTITTTTTDGRPGAHAVSATAGHPPVPEIPAPLAKEMQEHNARITRAIHEQLRRDHLAVERIDYKRPFSSLEDAIERLLPFHVYQFPWQDLDAEEKAFNAHSQQEKFTTKAKDLHVQRDNVFERYTKLLKREANNAKSTLPELEILATKLLVEDEQSETAVVKTEHDRIKQEINELQRLMEIREAQAAMKRKQEAMLIEQQQKLMLEREKERLRLEAERQAAVHQSVEQTAKALQEFQQQQELLKSHEELLQRQLEQRQVLLQQEQQQLQRQASATAAAPPGSTTGTPKLT